MTTPITPARIATLKAQLRKAELALRAEIREELLRSDNELYIDIAGRVHDVAEESVADLLADQNIAIIGRHVAELREIESALRRIDSGTYGSCVDCGEPISHERLDAVPAAARCLNCQTRMESASPTARFPKL